MASNSLRVWMLVAIAVTVASGHPSAAKSSSHKLDAALASVAGKEGHRTRVIWGENLVWGSGWMKT